MNAGEPYASTLGPDIADEVTRYHSAYYMSHPSPRPAADHNGWTDDLFPPDEAIRFYNRTRTQYPGRRRSPCSSSTTATSATRTRRPTRR